MRKKVYISGKIGEEVVSDATLEKFARAEKILRAMGYTVFNPTTSGLGAFAENYARANGTTFYQEILLLDLMELSKCGAIYLLPDWQDSPGARAELAFAEAIGLVVIKERQPRGKALGTMASAQDNKKECRHGKV